jgi:hypothetical protein
MAGKQVTHFCIQINSCSFDEVGENISQKGDGNAGGQNCVAAKDMRAQVRISFKDNHFTVLGFVEVDGRDVMCAIIIAAFKLKVTYMTGFNPLSKDTAMRRAWQSL